MSNTPDFLQDAEAPPQSAGDLKQAAVYAQEMLDLEARSAALNEELKTNDKRYQKIQLELLPDLLVSLGVKTFKLESGASIVVADFVRGSIPTQSSIDKADDFDRPALVARRTECFTWLRQRNADSLIKNTVVAEFGKGQDQQAKQLFQRIVADGFKASCNEEVTFQTLNSYLREQQKAGVAIPVDPFGLFVGKKATIKTPKTK